MMSWRPDRMGGLEVREALIALLIAALVSALGVSIGSLLALMLS